MTLDDFNSLARPRVDAVTRLLWGEGEIGRGLGFVTTSGLDAAGRGELAGVAAVNRGDLVHLDYPADVVGPDGVPVLARVDLFLPRGRRMHVFTRCRLVLPRGAERAMVVPRGAAQFHFRVEPGEVVQVPGRAGDVAAGVARADHRLAALMADAHRAVLAGAEAA